MAYIYCITNLINGKLYVGKTTYSITKRFKEHCRDCSKECEEKRPLYAAMNKYGIENFVAKELIECEVDELNSYEIMFIEKLNTYGHNGYNATKGGDGKILYDHNEIIELYKLGYSALQISEKIKCDRTLVTRVLRANGIRSRGNSKMVDLFDLAGNYIQTFDSTNDAAEWVINGLSSAKGINGYISNCCSGRRLSMYGYIWKYKNLPKL